MYDETIRQVTQRGERLADALAHVGIMPGKVVTGDVLERVFRALSRQRVALEGTLLKPNMVVPGIVFLSGGQDERSATAHLNAMNSGPESRPWRVSFSYGRALQDPALEACGGRAAGAQAGQQALHHRARCNSAASLGEYDDSMERDTADVAMASQRAHWSDD
jgi:fructose-bisphosphate aldolase class I